MPVTIPRLAGQVQEGYTSHGKREVPNAILPTPEPDGMSLTLTPPESSSEPVAIRDDIRALARAEVGGARAALVELLLARPAQIDGYFTGVAARLEASAVRLLAANAADLEAAEGQYTPAILDRGRLTPARLADMAAQ